LAAVIEARVSGDLETLTATLKPSELAITDWLYRNSEVLARKDNDDGSVTLSLKMTHSARDDLQNRLKHKIEE
jgi:GTP-binding protein HflX